MAEIPNAVLSQRLRELLNGRRVKAVVFMTYTLEPEFFEQEIVSLLAGDSLIQEPKVRLVQLEELLRGEIGPITVYYDQHGLRPDGPKKLDIRYVPVRVATGLFHPKIVVILAESADPDAPAESLLICGVLSANATKNAWWSRVECAHFETLHAGDRCSYRDDLLRLLAEVRKLGGREVDHGALDTIREWLKRESVTTIHATSDGRLRTRLLAGTRPFLDFLDEVRGNELYGASLEVISPFFDEKQPAALEALIKRFDIRESRVFLPTAQDGSATCSRRLYEGVLELPNCCWARLPLSFLRLGKDKNAKLRDVHAKVYRFLRRSQRYEALVVGSHNLTTAAHNRGGNFEASFVIERESPGVLDWWLEGEGKSQKTFSPQTDEEDQLTDVHIPFQLSYDWKSKSAEARWDGESDSPLLGVESAGSPLFELASLPKGEWVSLTSADAAHLERILASTSLLQVVRESQQRCTVLVQEHGMARKPSILFTLTVTDILEYWSRLTPEQRAAYLAEKGGNIPDGFTLDPELTQRLQVANSFFSSYAGIFHGFEMLRKQVCDSLENKQERQADYLLFGKRHDSLPSLIDRVIDDKDGSSAINRYLILLSARQLLMEMRKHDDDFILARRMEIDHLIKRTAHAEALTAAMDLGDNGDEFIAWFEKHFLRNLVKTAEASDV